MSFPRFLALLPLVACTGGTVVTDCTLATLAADLAGSGAEDCGTVEIDGDSSTVDACAVAAFQAGSPFVAFYELQGIDSAVSRATVSDGTTVWNLTRDSDPSGGGGEAPVVYRTECGGPSVVAGDDGHDVITCSSGGTPCSTQVCGTGADTAVCD
jgi:hypothetical protein